MPFVSQAQRAYLFANNPQVAKEFAAATPKGAKLPEHVGDSHSKNVSKAIAKSGHGSRASSKKGK